MARKKKKTKELSVCEYDRVKVEDVKPMTGEFLSGKIYAWKFLQENEKYSKIYKKHRAGKALSISDKKLLKKWGLLEDLLCDPDGTKNPYYLYEAITGESEGMADITDNLQKELSQRDSRYRIFKVDLSMNKEVLKKRFSKLLNYYQTEREKRQKVDLKRVYQAWELNIKQKKGVHIILKNMQSQYKKNTNNDDSIRRQINRDIARAKKYIEDPMTLIKKY